MQTPLEVAMVVIQLVFMEVKDIDRILLQLLERPAHPLILCAFVGLGTALFAQEVGDLLEVQLQIIRQKLANLGVFVVAVETLGSFAAVDIDLFTA